MVGITISCFQLPPSPDHKSKWTPLLDNIRILYATVQQPPPWILIPHSLVNSPSCLQLSSPVSTDRYDDHKGAEVPPVSVDGGGAG